MSNLKRKIGCESVYNSSDDDDLCAELDSVEVQYKKLKSEEDHFLCHICGRSLKHRQSLNTHLLSHTQTFYCPCGKQFKHKTPKTMCRQSLYFQLQPMQCTVS